MVIAQRQTELPVTFAAFADGLLSIDQVAVVAKRVPAHNDAEACDLARNATVAQLRTATTKHFFPKPGAEGDDGPTPAPAAEHQLTARFNDDGDFSLHGLLNAVDGALVNNALAEARDALFAAGNTNVTWLDAFREVCQRSLGAVTTPSRQDLYRVIVHLGTDGAWIHNGPALPDNLREHICCSGMIQPLWETGGLPINLGRARHIAPIRLRRVIEDRDRTCRHPSCNATIGREVHHIQHWQHGGSTTTTTENLGMLCGNHHRRHHNGQFTITGNADQPNGLTFRDRNGRIIEAAKQPRPPGNEPPPAPTKPYMHPTGERMQLKWLDYAPASLAKAGAAALEY